MSISKLLVAVVAAASVSFMMAGGANAQDTAPESDPAAEQAAPERSPEDNWLKVCGDPLPDGQKPCLMRQIIQQDGQFRGSFFVRDDPGQEDQLLAVAAVPVGVLLPIGMTWKIDGAQEIRLPYIFCDPSSCQTIQVLSEAYLNSLKKGNTLKLTAKTRQNEDLVVNITLAGFTSVYEGDDSVTFDQLRDQTTGAGALEQLLQDRAEQIRREQEAEQAGGEEAETTEEAPAE